ncbi:cytochrome oxidase assembly protein [Rhodanobacter sp. FW510-R12]|uniref:COX15/CtaA family protein n=1 Tax=unclassified Rhodanobacter TaxID=2621553 RepID=UPI0007A9BC65|nr:MULTISPECIES: COX15/CtaA family protein [unclassified Rhodanobacter]KZC18063.1 cytochrome oxidase assembly protein [Rhodanobacter sp. FW104-R8]KZC28223.1 cytochrome oxidase assembly protein [Rhodanobacter sp. FW510-T8]KZC33413.1 cytochrome oxidase assembly protein [Rhodanobacter sp. FW510-R10]
MSARSLKTLRWLALFAAVFAFGLVMFGAFVRLSNAGLSCPDWPTCYGQVTWPQHAQAVAHADAAFPDRPYEAHKAWREQVHRFLAGTLGVLVLLLAVLASWRRRSALLAVLAGAVFAALGVGLYMRGEHLWSSLLAACAIALPLLAAIRLPRPGAWKICVLALAVIIFQAMLGMWTVTLLLKPIVVMGHLLGGMATFALLAYAALRFAGVAAADDHFADLRRLVAIGIVLLLCQIALGGWTSANYAALACGYGPGSFPQCLGQWAPPTDFREGFVLWRGIGVNYEGGVLDMAARSAIQIAHRLGALVVFCYLGWLATRAARRGMVGCGLAIALALAGQVLLGISNVYFGLPLAVATAHNGVAALLLFTLLATLARTQRRRDESIFLPPGRH